jgi:acetamidase/formamidase
MRRVLLSVCLSISVTPALQAADYTLLATPRTVEWGYYDSAAKPALTVHSGDTVRIQSLSTCGSRKEMMSHGVKAEEIPPYTDPIDQAEPKDTGGGHILTGPVAIAEAEPGDVLEVQILKVDIDVDFACNTFALGYGFLPMEYPYERTKIIPLDRKRMIGHFAPGIELPLRPFFGSMGVAPAEGKLDSAPPFGWRRRAPCSRPAMGMRARATVKSTSRPSRPISPAPFDSSCTRTSIWCGRVPRRPTITFPWDSARI